MGFLHAEASMGAIGAEFLCAVGESRINAAVDHPYPRGRQGACYENAFRLARKFPELTYCEGRALSLGIVPIEHAWCVDEAGRVIDTTWDPNQFEYVGVRFATPFLVDWIGSRKTYGVLANSFPVALLAIEPAQFLASPSPEQLTGAQRVLSRARDILSEARAPATTARPRARRPSRTGQ